ncbi:hypothetical protein TNCV_160681 [Trichonephila clavipes]|nr:hypothetical protein TNCV_160681 [Trichonephila clavipes]
MASKRKHSTLTLKDKLEVLKRLDKGEGVTKLATEFNVGKASVGDINEWMEEDGETAEFLTDDDIATAVTQEPMEEEESDDETQCDKKDVVPHADVAAALDLALRYLEQQPDTTPADVLFMRRWRNYASSKRLSSLRQKKITELIFQVIYSQFGLAIHQNDHQARRRFVEWAQNEIAVVPDFHKRILFSDEAHFWLNGYVNKQNCRIWSEANPQVYVETPLHPEKLTVWCAL